MFATSTNNSFDERKRKVIVKEKAVKRLKEVETANYPSNGPVLPKVNLQNRWRRHGEMEMMPKLDMKLLFENTQTVSKRQSLLKLSMHAAHPGGTDPNEKDHITVQYYDKNGGIIKDKNDRDSHHVYTNREKEVDLKPLIPPSLKANVA
ncbi:hypothetical protein C8Q75DRAFT_373938 [Abortiporus biennis]|nr:hypothetical protein C8Q75DRAFT_373938 [Abortiporus biennis]